GGDMILCKILPDVSPVFGARDQINPKLVSPARIIPRRRNTLVAWLNTPRSITEITARGPSPVPSVYLHVLAQFPQALFNLPRAGQKIDDTPARQGPRAGPAASTKRRWFSVL